jgi:radical SAM superfamily enzyme YgiQ (UPF0313 family)
MRLFSIAMKPSPPLGLAFIASALERVGHNVKIIDAVAEKPDQFIDFYNDIVTMGLSYQEIRDMIPVDTDVIGFSLMFTNNWLSDKKLINYLSEEFLNALIIAGGEHITAVPELSLKQAEGLDICVVGEGEETIVELMQKIEDNNSLDDVKGIVYRDKSRIINVNGRRERKKDIEDIAWPAWHLFPLSSYQEQEISFGVVHGELSLPLMATRGCPYKCTFCSSPSMWGTRYYMRSPKDVVDEMAYFKKTYGAKNFDFYDLTAIIKKEWIIELCKELLERKLDITWQIPAGTRSEVIDREVSHYLYKAGCKNITYAPESGSPEILKAVKKKVVLSRMFDSVIDSRKENMNIKLNMIIGFPEETHRTVFQTFWFLIKSSWYGVNDMFPAVLVPYAGCDIYNRLLKEKRIDPETDQYYYDLIYSDAFFGSKYYNDNIPQFMLNTYRVLYLVIFYGTNYLFRPMRFFKTIRNLITKNFESRGESTLHKILSRSFFKKSKSKPSSVLNQTL